MPREYISTEFCRFESGASKNSAQRRATPTYKFVVSAIGVLAMADDTPSEMVELWIRSNLNSAWTLVNAAQYLSSKEAVAVIERLEDGFCFAGINRNDLASAIYVAAASGGSEGMLATDVIGRISSRSDSVRRQAAAAKKVVLEFIEALIGLDAAMKGQGSRGVDQREIDGIAKLFCAP